MSLGKLRASLEWHLHLWWIYVTFIACERHHKVCTIWARLVIIHLLDPVVHWVKGFFLGQIVANNGCSCIFVIEFNHCAEFLTATSVPDVQLDLNGWASHANFLRTQSNSLLEVSTPDSNIMLIGKDVFPESLCYTRLPNTRVSKQHNFCFKGSIGSRLRWSVHRSWGAWDSTCWLIALIGLPERLFFSLPIFYVQVGSLLTFARVLFGTSSTTRHF